MRFIELPIGRVFGKWTVLSRAENAPSGQGRYQCRCECGVEKIVFSRALRTGNSSSCRSCSNRVSKPTSGMRRSAHVKWGGFGEVSLTYFNSLKRGASGEKSKSGRVVDFSVSIECLWGLFLEQDRKCALTGLVLEMPSSGKSRGNASLDRIDSSKGYIPGNIQWVHKDINMMKWTLPQDRFVELCRAVMCGGPEGL